MVGYAHVDWAVVKQTMIWTSAPLAMLGVYSHTLMFEEGRYPLYQSGINYCKQALDVTDPTD